MIEEISKGLYVFKEPSFDNSKPLLIGIHPFYRGILDKPSEETIFGIRRRTAKEYLSGIKKIITEHEGSVFLFEEWPEIEKTAAYIQSLGRTKDVYLVSTKTDDPSPHDMKIPWKSLFDIIDESGNGEISLFGGWYFPNVGDSVKQNLRSIAFESDGLKVLLKKPIEKIITHGGCLGYFKAVLESYANPNHRVNVIDELTFV
jgi:hypothetical protein